MTSRNDPFWQRMDYYPFVVGKRVLRADEFFDVVASGFVREFTADFFSDFYKRCSCSRTGFFFRGYVEDGCFYWKVVWQCEFVLPFGFISPRNMTFSYNFLYVRIHSRKD